MMKRLFKWLGVLVAVVVLVLGVFVGWVQATWDADYSSMAKPAIAASKDPAVIARGEYLFNADGHSSTRLAAADEARHPAVR